MPCQVSVRLVERMKVVKERLCDTPIGVETLNNGKYVIKLTIAGESDYLTIEDAAWLFKHLFLALGELDDKIDRKERKGA